MKIRLLALGAILSAAALPALAKPVCGSLNNYRDYRTATNDMLHLNTVEGRHFTEDVEQAIQGVTGTIADDLEYTLNHYPNHPRALETALRMAPRYPSGVLPGASIPTECFFERAVRFFPDDSKTWLMYARYQYMLGREAQAQTMLEKAVALAPDDVSINYNLGLVYAKQKKFDLALPHAQKAYLLKFPLPGLKQMLVNAGKWVEPPAPPEAAPEPADAVKPEPAASAATPPVKP
ncbi:ABC transporter permease [Massilia sp. SR12]